MKFSPRLLIAATLLAAALGYSQDVGKGQNTKRTMPEDEHSYRKIQVVDGRNRTPRETERALRFAKAEEKAIPTLGSLACPPETNCKERASAIHPE